jgi:hypothetical protein
MPLNELSGLPSEEILQQEYRVSPGIPDIIPPSWRKYIDEKKLCDKGVNPVAATNRAFIKNKLPEVND